ncbi:Elongation factor G- mitochondrial [Apiospora marii]|uniref:Elongation factor G- mitochondrial n=1 Tax=Apiospora marii TaxID=335849 RepID=A0ABR1RKD0_9PEZI
MRVIETLVTGSLVAGCARAQTVQLHIAKRDARHDNPKLPVGRREAATHVGIITNEKAVGGYFTTVSIGSPAQEVTLLLDTGSSDLWVPSASACAKDNGCTFGSFDPSKSISFDKAGRRPFDIQYLDGAHTKGDYFADDLDIGGAKILNLTMALGQETDRSFGILGVGYALNEAAVAESSRSSSAYPNLPAQMFKEGLITTNAYSLWLNKQDAKGGQILFGGVDIAKYEGQMLMMDVQPDASRKALTSFIVPMTSLTATSPSGSDTLLTGEFPLPVVLDSGSTFTSLPTELAKLAWTEAGAVFDTTYAFIPCSMSNSKGSFEFGFAGPNGPKIKVPMSEMVHKIQDRGDYTFQAGRYKGQPMCWFGIQNSSSSDLFVLGDSFLRSAYVVYDLENNQIGMANTAANASETDSSIVAFPSKGAFIPGATLIKDQVTSTRIPSAFTSPAYVAKDGFRSAARPVSVRGWAQLGAIGAYTIFMLAGSALIL